MSKIYQTLQNDRLEHKEQLSVMSQLENPFGFLIIKSGNKSNLNIPLILKGFKPFGKIS
jgi:hypothetical protein